MLRSNPSLIWHHAFGVIVNWPDTKRRPSRAFYKRWYNGVERASSRQAFIKGGYAIGLEPAHYPVPAPYIHKSNPQWWDHWHFTAWRLLPQWKHAIENY